MLYFNFGTSKDVPYYLHSALESANAPYIIKNQGQNLNKY